MIHLTIDPSVHSKLKVAMPKTDKAKRALDKYADELTKHIEKSLLRMDSNLFKHYKQFYVSTYQLSLDVGQFTINGRKQYLHTWLKDNALELVHAVEVGLKGGNFSSVKLTELVTMSDAMDINTLRKKKVNELDALLNDKSLTDEDFFYRVFPDFETLTQSQLLARYDFCPIDTKSLKQFIVWLTHKANKFNDVIRQLMIRQANVILRIALAGDRELPMERNPSHFGRMYYHGTSVQSVHRELREAMLGDCYEYDMRSAVVSWKMGFAEEYLKEHEPQQLISSVFGASLFYLEDKVAFRSHVQIETFGTNSHISDDVQKFIVKQALTALSFGARIYKHGWIDQSGKEFNPALVSIIKDSDARTNFINCDVMKDFIAEQKVLDKYIFSYFTKTEKYLLTDPELQTASGQVSKSKVLAYLYQHAETYAMDFARAELKRLGHTVLASVHDAIFVRHKLSAYDKDKIEQKMRSKTGIDYWHLDFTEVKAYDGISAEVLRDEQEHKLRMEELERHAAGYKPQNF